MPEKLRHNPQLLHLFPNMITIAGLCVGLSALQFSMQENWQAALICIVAAALIDSVDGRVARILNVTSDFGAHLDSLADLISFGVAPAFIIYSWKLHELGPVGWAFSLFFVMCCAIRLARFNTYLEVDEDELPPWMDHFFVGMPSPAGGLLILMPVAINLVAGQATASLFEAVTGYINVYVVAGLVVFCALYMASRFPAPSIKQIRVPRRVISMSLALVGLLFILLLIQPWVILIFIGVIYLALLPFSFIYVLVKYPSDK